MSEAIKVGQPYRQRYLVQRQLATGGFSAVYLLRDTQLVRDLCLKKGVPGRGASTNDLHLLFANESKALSRLKGRYAPHLLEAKLEDLELYLEYCPGLTLSEYFERRAASGQFLSTLQGLQLTQRLARAVEHCHARGVVLGDLKPRNVVLTGAPFDEERSLVLLDFGASRVLGEDSGMTGHYSAGFGAPELLRDQSPNPASDVFSLGAIFFTALARRPPRHAELPRDFGDRTTFLDPRLRELVTRLTHEVPSKRPDVGEAIRCLRDLEQVLTRPQAEPVCCPHCGEYVPRASFCERCGRRLERGQTVAVAPSSPSHVSGRQSLELAFAREAWLDVISWARQADEDGSLDELGVVRAVVALTRLPRTSVFRSDLETWLRCGSGLSLNALPAAEQRAFLAAWGRLGRLATQHQVVAPAAHQYRAWFLYGCQQWPDEELLWVWLADASPEKECEVVLRQGLARNPESGILRRSLGEVLYRWGRFAEALTFWSEAIDRRAADLEVLAKAFRLAVQCSKATQADRLRRQILSSAPKDHSELIALIRFAREQGDISRALGLTEEGLADDPLDEALIKWKAQILFDQRKFELLLEHLKQMREEPDLLLLRGTAHYELGDYTRAARDLFGAITGGQSVPLAWLNLARSYDRLGHRHQALQALETARRQYPTDEPLRRLETSLRQVGG